MNGGDRVRVGGEGTKTLSSLDIPDSYTLVKLGGMEGGREGKIKEWSVGEREGRRKGERGGKRRGGEGERREDKETECGRKRGKEGRREGGRRELIINIVIKLC